MKTDVTQELSGGAPSRRRPRKPFPLGAPRALLAPMELLLDAARRLAAAERAAAYSVEGRDVTLLALSGESPAPHGRIAVHALAQGTPLVERLERGWLHAIPMMTTHQSIGDERRRFKRRAAVSSACLVLETSTESLGPRFDQEAIRHTCQALLAALDARAFADAVATDRSTGALNRAAFERAAAHEMLIAEAAGRPGALILLEAVSRREQIEVELAEEAMTLAAIALRNSLRTDDLIGRRGPDELSALLVDSDPAHLAAVLDRIMKQVDESLTGLGMDLPTLGAAAFPVHGSTLEEIDSAALDALEIARVTGPGTAKLYDSRLGKSPTAPRRVFLTGDPAIDARKASLLFESVLAANGAEELSEALDAVLRALFAATGADRAAVLTGDAARLEIAAARDDRWRGLGPAIQISRSACLRALALGRATCIPDTETVDGGVGTSAHDLRLRSVITVPLLGRNGPVGVLYADSCRPSFKSYPPEDLAYLDTLAAQAALAIENATMRERLQEENAALKQAAAMRTNGTLLVGSSPELRTALRHLPEIVASDSPALLLGESGTGKELVARTIHQLGPRARGSFVAQNCAALPSELLESELFGHAVGAFSGASRQKRGLLELAHDGTFFLDEVAELPLPLQAKLLRVLEDKEVRRVGETRTRVIDFRLLCATNRNLEHEVELGHFRRDLYYRINVFSLQLPPLRERRSDIAELARHFVAQAASRTGRSQPELTPKALAVLEGQPWPGNVRELANVIERAVALAHSGRIEPTHLGLGGDHSDLQSRGLRDILARVERDSVVEALAASAGNITAAAAQLGIARQQLQRLVRKYRLRPARE